MAPILDELTKEAETGVEHWRRLDFGTGKWGGAYFSMWELRIGDVIVAGPSVEACRNRMAAKLRGSGG